MCGGEGGIRMKIISTVLPIMHIMVERLYEVVVDLSLVS